MTEYVIVSVFRGHRILLVEKDRPEWQKGKLNLVGGKIEAGESVADAVIRELREETGLETDCDTLRVCGKIVGDDYIVHCAVCCVCEHIEDLEPRPREGETEKVSWHQFSVVKNDPRLIPNLKVIFPLLLLEIEGWEIRNTSGDCRDFSIHLL